MKSPDLQTVAIDLADRSYNIAIRGSLFDNPLSYAELPKAAAALIAVDYQPLPAIVEPATVAMVGASVHDEAPDNQCYRWSIGDADGTDAAIRGAAHVTRLAFRNNRLIPNAMEPRAAIGEEFAFQPYFNGTLFKQGTELVAVQRGNLDMALLPPQRSDMLVEP